MTVQKIRLGDNADGSPHYLYFAPGEHVVVTGPATGEVTTADGTEYDVTDAVIAVDSQAHAEEIADILTARFHGEAE